MNKTRLDNAYNKATIRDFIVSFGGFGVIAIAITLFACWGSLKWIQLISLYLGMVIGMPMVILGTLACLCDEAKYKYYEGLTDREK